MHGVIANIVCVDWTFKDFVEVCVRTVEAAGIVVLMAGLVVATARLGLDWARDAGAGDLFRSYRRNLGRAILIGLELLVAADIINTVAIAPDFRSVGVLAAIVAIRTFLSVSLELEMTGRWPWEPREVPGR